MAHETLRFEFVDGTAELVRHGSRRYWELLEDGHTPVGSVPAPDGISDALQDYLAVNYPPGVSKAEIAADVDAPGTDIGDALAATFATAPGANLARTIRRLQAGEDLKFTAIGDSIADPSTAGNTGGGPVEKLAALLQTRFGVAITIDNQAKSGYTALRSHVNGAVVAAINAQADVFFVCLGKNDIGSDLYGQYAAGYPLAASLAAVERVCAAVRRDNDKADIVIIGEGPYEAAATAANAALLTWETEARKVAATWGAEFVDVYSAFIDYGDYSGLMYDSTHQNPAGNDLYAATLAEHFPVGFNGPTTAIAPPATKGLYGVDKADADATNYGYVVRPNPATVDGLTYVQGGTGWASDATTTVGDYAEVSAYATELHAQVSTAVVDAAVVDVSIDGAVVAANVNLSTQGKNGTYWVPFATGLSEGTHTLRLTLKSGTLRVTSTAALMAPGADPFADVIRVVDVPGLAGTVSLPTDGSYIDLWLPRTLLSLPAGWGAMRVDVSGWVQPRVTAGTTTPRAIDLSVIMTGGSATGTMTTRWEDAVATNTFLPPVNVSMMARDTFTADATIGIQARVSSTDKTNCQVTSVWLSCKLIRTA